MAPLVMPVFPAVGLLKAHETGENGRLLVGIIPLLQLILALIVAAGFHCAGHHGQHGDAYLQPGNETLLPEILQQSVEFSGVFLAEVGSKTSREITDLLPDAFRSLGHHADSALIIFFVAKFSTFFSIPHRIPMNLIGDDSLPIVPTEIPVQKIPRNTPQSVAGDFAVG